MKYLYVLFIFLFPLISFAAESSPGNLNIDYYKLGGTVNIGFMMPYGINGKYLYLENKGKVFASSTLIDNTPFTQSGHYEYKLTKSGSYEIKALLCRDASKLNCSTSNPINLIYKNNEIIDEDRIMEDDIAIVRKRMLDEKKNTGYKNLIVSNIIRTNNLKVGITKDYLNKENVLRVRKIFNTTNLSSIVESSGNYTTDDFYKLVATYPSFCNEVTILDSKDTLCARELSAYLTLLLWYTNNEVKSEYLGMNNRNNLGRLFGIGVPRDLRSKDMFESLLDYYMKDRNPEPSMHSSMTYGFLINENDHLNNISNGFGGVQNIATHGDVCSGRNTKVTMGMADLYKRILKITKVEDINNSTCDNQKQFSILSNSFYPQYSNINPQTNKCELMLFESDNLKKCKIDNLNNTAANAVLEINKTRNSNFTASNIPKVDERISLGKNIAVTYSYKNAYDNRLAEIPYNKINTIIYEDAYLDTSGSLRFNDNYIALDKLFKGDCFRVDCKRGLLNYLKTGKQINKDLKIILDIQIDDVTIFKSNKNIELAVKQISDFVQSNDYIDGITVTISKLKYDSDSDYLRKFIANMKTKWQGSNKIIAVRLYPSEELIKYFEFKQILEMVKDVYILAYDIHTPKEKLTGHGAQILALSSSDDKTSLASLLVLLKNKGVDKSMISIGVPMFGRVWNDAVDNRKTDTPGMHVPHKTNYDKSYISYKDISDYYLLRGSNIYYEDKLRQASYLYDGKTLITYDSREMVEKKVKYLFSDAYKGVMLSDISSDNGDLLESVLSSIKKDAKRSCSLERKIKTSLRLGSVGADVYALQKYLKCSSYLPSYFEINGNYNTETSNAVRSWQTSSGLKNTGIIDASSTLMLNR